MAMLGSILLVGGVLLGQAAAGADDDLRVEVRRLVRQLNAPYLAQREGAEQRLLRLGPKVLDLLPEGDDRTPAEVAQRVGRIRQQLQQALAEATAGGSTVTLSGEARPLSQILAALQEQSGNKIVDFRKRFGHPLTDPQLSVEFDETPFWRALDQVLDQAELKVYAFGHQRAIHLVAREEDDLPRAGRGSYSGPFRLEPIRVMARRDLRNPEGDSLLLTLEVAWEPRLKPVGLKQRMADLEAVDENGNPLAFDRSQAELEVPGNGDMTAVELNLPLALPPREVKEIAGIKGTLTAMIPGRTETFAFDNLLDARNVEKRTAGVTVILDRVRKNNELYEVRVVVRFDQAGAALESHRGWILNNEAYLEGPDGKPISQQGMRTFRQTPDEVGIAYLFVLDDPPSNHKFVYKTPGVIVATGFDYEIKGLKLP
jgi:hypothetical protein